MNKRVNLVRIAVVLLALVPLVYLYAQTLQFGFFGDWREVTPNSLHTFSLETNGTTAPITLPHVMTDGTPGQQVVLATTLQNAGAQRLYFKSVFAPVRVYANDVLIYDYGAPQTFPAYLQDPPMMAATVELPKAETIFLRLEYTYPTTRGDLILDELLVGSYPAIFSKLLSQQEPHLFLYLAFLVLGLFLLLMGLLIRLVEHQGVFFVWLGLIALGCSLWGLGEYDPTGLFIHNAGLVALITFTSVFYLPIPIHCFFRSTVQYHNPQPMTLCTLLSLLVATTATVLQATSLVSYYNALPYFAAFAIASFCFGIGYTVYEWRIHENQLAKWFLLPWAIVILTALVESIYFVQGRINSYGQFVQLALLAFILINCAIGFSLIQKAFALREENRRIEHAYSLMELQVTNQQRYHHLLMETRQALRAQRHDLHHQLAAIQHLAQEGAWDKLTTHLQGVVTQIPQALEVYCENVAVNAVVDHYISKAKALGVDVSVQLEVSEHFERIGNNSLCVIFGNILENAVEACGRMGDDGRFLTLNASIRNGMLVITQKNSFEGHLRTNGEVFFSAKRDEAGVGIASVQAVARKHSGNATFSAQGRVFHAYVYVGI